MVFDDCLMLILGEKHLVMQKKMMQNLQNMIKNLLFGKKHDLFEQNKIIKHYHLLQIIRLNL
jgi:hypothetical protein